MRRYTRGKRLLVRLKNDDRWLEAVYLGPAGDAVDRPDRRMIAVDDGEKWNMVMSPSVDEALDIVRVKRKVALSVRCTYCKTPPGRLCKGFYGPKSPDPHARRISRARTEVVMQQACPQCNAPPGADCKGVGKSKCHQSRWVAAWKAELRRSRDGEETTPPTGEDGLDTQ